MKTIISYVQHVVDRDIIFKHEKKCWKQWLGFYVDPSEQHVCLVKNALRFNCQNIKTAVQFKFITNFKTQKRFNTLFLFPLNF